VLFRSTSHFPFTPLLLLLSLSQPHLVANCQNTFLEEREENCYTTESRPCRNCDNGLFEVESWSCGACNCERCCQKNTYEFCRTCSQGYALSSDRTKCTGFSPSITLSLLLFILYFIIIIKSNSKIIVTFLPDINECQSQPCLDGTSCTNLPGSFTCGPCPDGTEGNGQTGCTRFFPPLFRL